MFKKLVVLMLALFVPVLLLAQNGSLKGKVIDNETGAALVGANISVVGTSMGAATDANGDYTIAGIPPGAYQLSVSYIGYMSATSSVNVIVDEAATVDIGLDATAIKLSEIITEVSRAEVGKTPAAFTNVSAEELSDRYTTQDIPALLAHTPGVFANSNGLGEAQIYIRGFNTDHIRVEVNGIAVNDPEGQTVYFSNWTGLASNANVIQVQRGAGSWLYGSGFGGSMNVNTMGVPTEKGVTIRSSVGMYSTDGNSDGDIANGAGGFDSYSPANYIFQARYNSGSLADGKIAYSVMAERKAGSSYVDGTNYNGYSFGLELESRLNEKHILMASFLGAPQDHRQSRTIQDPELFNALGREYNRNNHKYQENYFFKPQASLRHFWQLNDNQSLTTNVFITSGKGGGRYHRNDSFDPATGAVTGKPVDDFTDNKYFGRHARYVHENTGIVLAGYNPADQTYDGVGVSRAANIISGSFNHSWKNDSQNEHVQGGLNTAYEQRLNDKFKVTVGGETRRWVADHFAESFNFAYNGGTFDEVQRRYDYTTTTVNFTGFGRVEVNPIPELTIQAGGQYASSKSSIEDNEIAIFDFGAGQFSGQSFRTVADQKNADGSTKYSESDFERTYTFFSPKVGANYNLDKVNLFAVWSIDNKEPKVGDWFSRTSISDTKLDAEKLTNYEIGLSYNEANFALGANVYLMDFEDKIERVTEQDGNNTTVNAGAARHKGIELNGVYQKAQFDASGSFTFAENRWEDMSLDEIFGVDAADVVGKVVPYSPERMANFGMGYKMMENKLRIGLGLQWWDEYYGSYTNTYNLIDGSEAEAKLPSFFELNASISYKFNFGGQNLMVRLDANNLTNHDHFSRADYTRDFNRTDDLGGEYYMYVQQAPLRNFFLTTQFEL